MEWFRIASTFSGRERAQRLQFDTILPVSRKLVRCFGRRYWIYRKEVPPNAAYKGWLPHAEVREAV